ncbi:MAG: B12-binding domain-containing protein [Haloarculaceae archaeon]
MTDLEDLQTAVVAGETDDAVEYTSTLLSAYSAERVLDDGILPAAKEIGNKYETGEYFLADLMQCGDTLEGVMDPLTEALKAEVASDDSDAEERATVVLATVEEDIHDIGKNLVRMFVAGNGHDVHDVGVDVPPEEVVETAEEVDADVIGLSALMSVTRDNMADVIDELESRGEDDRFAVLVGGRSTNAEWAEDIGADGWAPDGPGAAEEVERLHHEVTREAGGA